MEKNVNTLSIDNWIPHRGTMQLLDRMVDFNADLAVAEVDVPAQGLFVRDGQVPAWVGLEYMAQTVSAWAGGRARSQGGVPRLGLLLGSRRYVANCDGFPCGVTLRIEARCDLMGDNGLGMFDCSIHMTGQEVATAKVAVFEPGDAHEFLGGGVTA